MAIAAFVFWLGRKKFVQVPPNPGGKLGRIDFFASTLLIVPLLLGVYVLLEESEEVVHAVTDRGTSALMAEFASIATHYWWVALVGLATLIGGFSLAHMRQKIKADSGFLAVLFYSIRNRNNREPGEDFWGPARRQYGNEAAEGPPAVLAHYGGILHGQRLLGPLRPALVHLGGAGEVYEPATHRPALLWTWWMLPATVIGALFGAIWLFSWVSNVTLPKVVRMGVPALLVLWGVVVGILQLTSGGSTTLDLLPAQIAPLTRCW